MKAHKDYKKICLNSQIISQWKIFLKPKKYDETQDKRLISLIA